MTGYWPPAALNVVVLAGVDYSGIPGAELSRVIISEHLQRLEERTQRP